MSSAVRAHSGFAALNTALHALAGQHVTQLQAVTDSVSPAIAHTEAVARVAESFTPVTDSITQVFEPTSPLTKAFAHASQQVSTMVEACQPYVDASLAYHREIGGKESLKWGQYWHRLRPWVLMVSACASELRARYERIAAGTWGVQHSQVQGQGSTWRQPGRPLPPATSVLLVATLSNAPSAPGLTVAA